MLEGKVVLVTGAARGIGAKLAADLAGQGARVVLSDVLDPKEAAEGIAANGGAAVAAIADITKADDLERVVQLAENRFGPVDVLINNASIFAALRTKPFEEIDEEEWDRVMRVNVRGTFQACKAVVPSMVRAGGGKIINVSSGTFFYGPPGLLHYVASKGAIIAMTRSLARELGDRNILVNAIAPGLTMSEGVEDHPDLQHGRAPTAASRVIKRDMLPSDLFGVVRFLAGSDSDFMTGQLLNVDGGKIMY